MKKYNEWLSDKRRTENTGENTLYPPKNELDVNSGGSKAPIREKTAGYNNSTKAVDPNVGKFKDGFPFTGDKKLIYTPGDLKADKQLPDASGIPNGKLVKPEWTKTQEWIDSTKDLSMAEFVKTITPDSEINNLIREMKRNKTFNKFIEECLQHEETYKVIAKFLEEDEKYAKKIVRAINELVAPSMNTTQDDETDESPDEMKKLGSEDDSEVDTETEDENGENEADGSEEGSENDEENPMHPPMKKKHAHDHLKNALGVAPMAQQDMSGLSGNGSNDI